MEENKSIKIQTGLVTDVDPIDQPKGSYTFMLNGVADAHDGKKSSRVTEPGNELCFSLKDGYKVVGTIYTENDEMVIFSTNGTMSEIGKAKRCHYTTLVNADLGFDTKHPITGEYRVRGGCDPTIYWNDGFNKDRYLILNDLDAFKTDGDWDINKFNYAPIVMIPDIEVIRVNNTGGSLLLGQYKFQIELLDSDLNTLYKSYVSQGVSIYDESSSSDYNVIDGGLNEEVYSEDIGGVPPTTKSIDLRFDNVDTTATYIRLNVLRYVYDTPDATSVGLLIPITGSSVTFTYDGFNADRGDTFEDIDKFLIPTITYTTSSVMEQVQNRLVRGNVKSGNRDYSAYQAIVNQIVPSYYIKTALAKDNTAAGNPKNPTTYKDSVGYMGGEVYAFGIVFVYEDGSESPAFHIPGRAAIPGLDKINLTVTTSLLPAVKHLAPPNGTEWQVGDTVEAWKVGSTSQGDGMMDYYETSFNYPETISCDGTTPIYGDLAGTPIRHHKFPDRSVESHYGQGRLRHYGLQLDNIQFPDSDIIGYYIVRARRTNNDRLIFDKGFLGKAQKDRNLNLRFGLKEEGVIFETMNNEVGDSDYVKFISPKLLFDEQNTQGTHFRSELFLPNPEENYGFARYGYINAEDDDTSVINRFFRLFCNSYALQAPFNRTKLYNDVLAPEEVKQPFGNQDVYIGNASQLSPVSIHRLEDDWIDPIEGDIQGVFYVADKVFRDVYANLESIVYYRTHDGIFTDTTTQVMGGDTFISELVFNSAYAFNRIKVYGGLYAYSLQCLYVESEINCELRHSGTADCNKYLRYGVDNSFDFFHNKRYFVNTDGANVARAESCRDFYGYNDNYNVQYRSTLYSGLPINFDYCNECVGRYPYRIIFSPKSFSEEIYDNYRVNAVDDYIELPAHRGEITGIKYKNNQLLVHTKETTFLLQPNPQTIATDQNTAYLNTGDFLSIPPYELQQTDTGFGGSQSRIAYINNEHGYFWVDQMNGKVFKWSNKFDTITSLGMSQWFDKNLPSQLNKQTNELSNTDYSYLDSIGDDAGIGVQLAYDPHLKRLILRKKDFKRIKADPLGTDFYNKKKYENKSFTISFDLLGNYWTSYHSYHPDWMYNDRDAMYALKQNESWRFADKGSYLSYFGKLAPFILETVHNDYATHDLHSLQYVAVTERYDEDSDEWVVVDNTFDQGIFYNDKETSGLMLLEFVPQDTNPYGTTLLPDFIGKIVKRKDNYSIAGMRDVSTAQPVMSKAWDVTQDSFDQHVGYIDKLPINFDLTKDQYQLKNLNGKWVKSRLIYNQNDTRFRMTVHLVNNKIYKLIS
jgi:hypothetical protein